jgi:hypothetical protein
MSNLKTLQGFERLLKYLKNTKNERHYYIQLAHLENQLNRQKLGTNNRYRAIYNGIRSNNINTNNYNNRVRKGKKFRGENAAVTVQNYYRGHLLRKAAKRSKYVKSPTGSLSVVTRKTSANAAIRNAARKANELMSYANYLNRIYGAGAGNSIRSRVQRRIFR